MNSITLVTATVDNCMASSKRYLSLQSQRGEGAVSNLAVDSFEDAIKPCSKDNEVMYIMDLEKRLIYVVKELENINNPSEDEANEIPKDCLGFYLSYDEPEFAEFETEEDIEEFRKKYGNGRVLTVNFIYKEDFGAAELNLKTCIFFV